MATRKGKKLKVLADGHPRRLADGRNAWRKMSADQRAEFVRFMVENDKAEKGYPEVVVGVELQGSGLRVWFGWAQLKG